MEVKAHFDHFNINVTNIEKSLDFYHKTLGFEKLSEIRHPSGDFIITYIGKKDEPFRLELTWLKEHTGAYELGENESHLALRVDDFDVVHEYHKQLGVICYENPDMGIYFINDPDDYWIEILPCKNSI